MFRCREVAERASLLIDGELGPLQRFNMKLHLAMCRGCRTLVEQMRIAHEFTRMAGGPDDRQIGEEIQAALAQRRSRRKRRN